MRLFLLVFLLLSVNAGAAAWLKKEGESEVDISSDYYFANKSFDNQGSKYSSFYYGKYSTNPYMEYGVTNDMTIGGGMSLVLAHDPNTGKQQYNADDLGLFVRTHLYDGSIFGYQGLVTSAEWGFYLPVKSEGEINQQSGLSPNVKFNIGYSDKDYFASYGLGYEYWPGEESDRINTSAIFGYNLSDDFTYMLQTFTTNIINENFAISGNYNLAKLESSILWKYDEVITHQMGISYDLFGKNTGAGYGFLYSVWYKF